MGKGERGPTTTEGERIGRGWEGGEGREKQGKGFAGPMLNCFLRACCTHISIKVNCRKFAT